MVQMTSDIKILLLETSGDSNEWDLFGQLPGTSRISPYPARGTARAAAVTSCCNKLCDELP